MTHVDGPVERGKVILYALSTCIWCRKTRHLLEQLGVAYDYEYVDLAASARADEIEAEIKKTMGHVSYPTIVTDRGHVQGYRPDDIKKLLNV
jgi:glutaredoxin